MCSQACRNSARRSPKFLKSMATSRNSDSEQASIGPRGGVTMDFDPSDKVKRLSARLREFMEAEIYPAEKNFEQEMAEARDRWQVPPIMEKLKTKARTAGL